MKIVLVSSICSDLGVSTIAPLLKKDGHRVSILFVPALMQECSRPPSDKVISSASEFIKGADIVGINSFSENYSRTAALADGIKKATKVPLVWGGIHATIKPGDCIKHADIVCIGEGEEAMLELAGRMERGEELENIKNLLFRSNRETARGVELRPPVDLDSLLPLDYDLDSQYVAEGNKIRNLEEPDFKGLFISFSSRGCPFLCSYCSNAVILNMYKGQRFLRQRNIKNVIADLKEIKKRFLSCETIWFNEADFISGKTQGALEEFSRRYKAEVGIPFTIWSHPAAVSDENIRLLEDAGLKKINMGTISGSDKTQRRIYKRNARPDLYRTKGEILNKYGVEVEYDVILCNPYETDNDLIGTAELLTKLPKPCRIVIYSLTYFPKTELYGMALRDGLINEDRYVLSYTKAAYKAWGFRSNSAYLNIVLSLTRGLARRMPLLGLTIYGVFLPEFILKFLIKKPVINFLNHLPLSSFIYRIIGDSIRIGYGFFEKISRRR